MLQKPIQFVLFLFQNLNPLTTTWYKSAAQLQEFSTTLLFRDYTVNVAQESLVFQLSLAKTESVYHVPIQPNFRSVYSGQLVTDFI